MNTEPGGMSVQRRWVMWAYVALGLFYVLVPDAHGQIPAVQSGDSQVFGSAGPDTIVNTYMQATSGWLSAMSGAAHSLFWSLAGIDFTWTAITMALKGVDFQQWVAGFVRKILTIGLFAAILDNGAAWTQGIVNFFIGLGSAAGGESTTSLSASGILGSGIDIAGAMFGGASGSAQASSSTNPVGGIAGSILPGLGILEHFAPTLILAIGAFFIVVAFAIVACHFVMAMVEAYVVLGAGYVFLGFGGSRWTVPYMEKYIGLLIAAGVRIMVIELLIGLAQNLSQQWIQQAQSIASVPDLLDGGTVNGAFVGIQNEFALVGSILIFGILCWTVPQIASNVIGGSLSLGGGDAIGTAAAAGGAAFAGASAASGAISGGGGGGSSKGAHTVAEMTQAAAVGVGKGAVGAGAMVAGAAVAVGSGGTATPAVAAAGVGGVTSAAAPAAGAGAGSAILGGGASGAAGGVGAGGTPAVPVEVASAAGGGAGTPPSGVSDSAPKAEDMGLKSAVENLQDAFNDVRAATSKMPNSGGRIGGTTPNVSHGDEE